MSLVVFIAVAGVGAVVWWPLGRWPWARAIGGVVALGACLVVAYGLPTAGLVRFGDEALQPTRFLRLWLLTGTAATLLLTLVAEALGRPTRLAPAALVTLGGTAAALAVTDAAGALLLVVATGTLVGLIALADRDTLRGPVRIEGLRVTVGVAVLALLGMAWGATGGLSLQPATALVAFALVAGALALGTGTVPLHLPLTRQAEAVARPLVPLVVGWLPAALALVLLGWADVRLVPVVPDLGPARAIVVGLGFVTLGATSIAMLLQEDVGHVVAYAGVQGLAVGLLAYAAVDVQALPAARVTLLLLPLWLAALTAAVLVLDATSGLARVPALAGRLRQVPVTTTGMAIAAIVAVGVPGLAGFDARRTILDLAAGSALATLGLLVGAASVLAWLRVLWVGLRPAEGGGEATAGESAAGVGDGAATVGELAAWGAAERPTRPPSPEPPASWFAEDPRALLAANRVPISASLVLLTALLAMAVSLGLGHLPADARGPIPLASVRPTPTPGPTQPAASPGATESPGATGSAGATGSPAATVSPAATALAPSASAAAGSPTPGTSPTPGSSTGD